MEPLGFACLGERGCVRVSFVTLFVRGQWGCWVFFLGLTLGGDDAAFAEGVVQELEVRLLEEGLCGAFWIAGVGDDDVEFVLAFGEELEAVTDVGLHFGVAVADGQAGEVFLREADDGLFFFWKG